MRQLLCLSGFPWEAVPNRTQQLMSRMKDAEVLFFVPPADRGSRAWRGPGRKVRPGVIVYTLPPEAAPGSKAGLLLRWSESRTARFLQDKMARHHFREPVLWCTGPEAVRYLDALAYRGLVYDCDRDWPALPVQWESDLAVAAEVIFAASPDLVTHLAPCNSNVALLPNGANYQMFARDDLPPSAALMDIPHPILAWAGTIWADLDLSPLLQTARSHPDCTVVLAGRAEEGNRQLAEVLALPNVHFLDFVPLVDLPDLLCGCDVCLYLLRRSRLDDDVIPPRMFEYLATGKPVVAMLRPDQVEDFPDVVYGAHTPAEFSLLCGRALEESGVWARDRRREYGRAAAWSERAAEVERILESISLF